MDFLRPGIFLVFMLTFGLSSSWALFATTLDHSIHVFIVRRIMSFLPLLFVVPNPTFSRIPFPNFRVVWW